MKPYEDSNEIRLLEFLNEMRYKKEDTVEISEIKKAFMQVENCYLYPKRPAYELNL